MVVQSKLPTTGTTIFSVMTALANETGAVNLSQGFPDFHPPSELVDSVTRALASGFNQYAPMPGVLTLREAVARRYKHFFEIDVDPETEITITPGGTAAIYTAVASLVFPSDKVLIFQPAYDSYAPAVTTFGGQVVRSTLQNPHYLPDWNHVEECCKLGVRVIIINSPHNPSGAVLRESDISALAYITRKYGCYIISDEVYDLITFDQRHIPVASHPDLRDCTFTITSFGKLIHATGWKVGACVAAPQLTTEFRKVHQFLSFSVNTPMQIGLAEYLGNPNVLSSVSSFLREKRDVFQNAIHGSLWKIRPCAGTYFQLLDYSAFWSGSDIDLAQWLATHGGVASIPLSPFLHDSESDTVLRFCFAKRDDVLKHAGELLVRAAEGLARQQGLHPLELHS